jgi:outer membrane lipoprotein SlyB
MKTINEQIKKITSNPLGSLAGAAAFYFGAKQMGKVENTYALIGLAVVGAIAGAMAQANFMPKGAPTAATVK